MPKGPQGQKRPADSIGCANLVAKIATGEEDDEILSKAKIGVAGGQARTKSLSSEERKEIAVKAAQGRWKKEDKVNMKVDNISREMFSFEGPQVCNVKFFLGSDRSVTAEQLADQLDRANAQIRSNAAAPTKSLDGDLTVTKI